MAIYINDKPVRTKQINDKTHCSVIDLIMALPKGQYGQTNLNDVGYRYSASAVNIVNVVTVTVTPNEKEPLLIKGFMGANVLPALTMEAQFQTRPESKWKGTYKDGFDYMAELDKVCSTIRGYGFTVEISKGQGELTLDKCVKSMDDYLQSGVLSDDVISWMAENGDAIVNNFISGDFYGHKNDTKFNDEILAWTNFWNYRIMNFNENPYLNKTLIRANVIKAMIAQESSMGTAPTKNAIRNIMQSLAAGDYSLWIAAAINPLEEGRYHLGSDGKPAITIMDGNSLVHPNGDLPSSFDSAETRRYRFGNGFRMLDSVITTGGGTNGREYVIHFDAVTHRMSIAVGVGVLAYKININAGGIEETGVIGYGTGSGYEALINKHLKNLGAAELRKTKN